MTRAPFILLDDARSEGASDARLYEQPVEVIVARRPDDVEAALAQIAATPGDWAGYFAYEAGLALEPRLAPLAAARTGATGPLIWFARFAKVTRMPSEEVERWLARQITGPGRLGPLGASLSAGGYARAFGVVQEAIRAGDIYQANLTFPLAGTWDGDPLAIYADIRRDARAGYGGIIWDGAHWHLSFSPELFFKLAGGQARVRPMKGTAPRGATPEEDARFKAELSASVKDRAENLMIVDLMRNDLSRVSQAGTVKVEAPFAIESYPTVHQMVTTVRAQLAPGEDVRSLLRAIFPCGSITGAPKIRAMEIIDRAERDARGVYCGSIGRIDPSGDAAFNVAIRTVRLSSDHPGATGGRAVMGVGSAVVADSVMIGEWRECVVKGNFLRLTAGHADLIETMAFDPAKGIELLELHLERMKASALALGFSFDRHAIRNAIHALCFDLEAPSKVRLVASKGGAHALEASALPAPMETITCAVLPLPVSDGDWRLRHKTTDRAFYEAGLAAARKAGAGEALFLRDDGLITEGTFTNVFVERDGTLLTPRADLGLLPGVLRRSLLDAGRATEADLTLDDLSGGFLVGNALRGLIPARLLGA
ncbi:para-aminobenzoate synthetase/4-amino-4-deoxychorismate lyase [Novosphingobium hassiacum]|uniref:Probable branched-chain-amino-acid aminotransferase n=1 Tax=Novosphingobium hassiacum TaxID=173676 RepID=A0A7W5ZVJ8_9SPHN|nr:aminodeoxychorismate synthase component I [Novosphingobium hassiacum]MBB3860172.1 para-aminobenzoate synthetase/4-amino-4-deoxychorismate lyase [Novosphingobium hassiacum]